jgi:hypothetical protein
MNNSDFRNFVASTPARFPEEAKAKRKERKKPDGLAAKRKPRPKREFKKKDEEEEKPKGETYRDRANERRSVKPS